MMTSPTTAERLAMKTAWAALNSSPSPTSEVVETIVFGLGSAGLLMDPETAAELPQEYAAEADRLRALVAAMHAASVGETRPPLLGYVEDVAITRSAFLAQQHRADMLDGIARREQTWRQRYETENSALKARLAELQSAKTRLSAVLDLCDSEQRGAMRWENPLPVPEWVAVVQRVALGDAAPAKLAPVAAPPAPAVDSPAARLGAALRDSQPDVQSTDVIDDTLLRLHVRPQSLDGWRWWLDHLAVDVGSITHKGADATCRGELDGVRVLMAGFGVGDLQATARRDAEAGERS